MDRNEYNQWGKDLAVRLPAIHAWVEGLSDTAATRKTWFDLAFTGFSLEEAMEVTKQIQAGTVEIGKFPSDWQELPRVYRQAVCENRLARIEHDRRSEPCDFGQYRVSCVTCRDTGHVTCWSLDAMHRARRRLHDDTAKQAWTTCAVPCSCSRGDRYSQRTTRRGRDTISEDVPRYDDEKWIRLDLGKDADDRLKLTAWAESYESLPLNDFGEYSPAR
jgi:hypothetical protein